MNKLRILATPKGAITFIVLLAIIWPSYYYYIKWKNQPVVFPETKPVVLDDGNTVYTLYHRDPRGEEVEIYPWTITLPSDAYVWREEAMKETVRSIKINGVSLNTNARPNSAITIWLKWPEMEFLSKHEEADLEHNKQGRHGGVDEGTLISVSIRGILQTSREWNTQSEIDSLKRQQGKYYVLDVSEVDQLQIEELQNNQKVYKIADPKQEIILSCGKFSCYIRFILDKYVNVVAYISQKNIGLTPHIKNQVSKLLNKLIDVPEKSQRTAW